MLIAFLLGLSLGIVLIVLFIVLKKYDKQFIYGLILTGIGFLYVGFTWSDQTSLIITSIQAISFLMLAYYGMKRSLWLLAIGYFLHGIWDLVYTFFDGPGLIPPDYDVFCLTIDFVIGLYLILLARNTKQSDKAFDLRNKK